MGKITVETCEIEGLKVITPTVFGDARGYFMETYNYNDFKEAGIDQVFVQDNQSASVKNVLRGLHFQINYPQDKLVRVVVGEVFDVAVDLRPGSRTYGKWFVCADMDGTVMYDMDLRGPIGLVIGNEGEGVSRLVKEKCDFTASIPMKGEIDSLNASVAAGVLAYEIVRQRLKG